MKPLNTTLLLSAVLSLALTACGSDTSSTPEASNAAGAENTSSEVAQPAEPQVQTTWSQDGTGAPAQLGQAQELTQALDAAVAAVLQAPEDLPTAQASELAGAVAQASASLDAELNRVGQPAGASARVQELLSAPGAQAAYDRFTAKLQQTPTAVPETGTQVP